MEYRDLTKYLQDKYGIPFGSYFLNESCSSQNKSIKRNKDGLYIHHIAEYHKDYPYINNLSTREEALKYPFEFQTGKWLCYADAIEHIILHYHIHRLRRAEMAVEQLNDGIVVFMLPQIKEWYKTNGSVTALSWEQEAWNRIKNEKQSFIEIYNMFYKEFPMERKFSYQEFHNVRKHK